jgi:hypothetical protein
MRVSARLVSFMRFDGVLALVGRKDSHPPLGLFGRYTEDISFVRVSHAWRQPLSDEHERPLLSELAL